MDLVDVDDANVPSANWTLGTNAQDEPTYFFQMPITFEAGQRGTRQGQLKQKIRDMTFFLETNDRAFLEGRSLIGTYDFSVRVEDLGGRVPGRLFAEVRYTYDR